MYVSKLNFTTEMQVRNVDNNNQVSLPQALNYFKIDTDKILAIHTKKLRLKYIRKLFLLKEFEIGATCSGSEYVTNIKLLEQHYRILRHAKLMEQNESDYEYSELSVGLNEFDIRSLYEDSFPEANQQTVLKVGPKDQGVEPGFIGIQIHDLLCIIEQEYPDATERRQFLAKNHYDKNRLLALLDEKLPRYIIKLHYKAISHDNMVSADPADLRRSQTIKDCYSKFGNQAGNFALLGYEVYKKKPNSKLINEALNEVIASDIARVYAEITGMTVHDQVLFPGKYPEKDILKIMLKAPKIQGAEPWVHFGGSKEGNFNNYIMKPVILPLNNIIGLADQNIHFAHILALLLWLADRDKIGKKFDNFLRLWDPVRKCYVLVAFDFGKAFQAFIIDQLSPAFHIKNPKFVNYSAFYGPREEMMLGMHILYRLNNQFVSENILQSYGADFYENIKKIHPFSHKKICDDYLQKFKMLTNKFIKDFKKHPHNKDISYNISACNEAIKHMQTLRETISENLFLLIDKYKHYFPLEKFAVKLIELVEKVIAGKTNTCLRSENGKIFLRYLRIMDKKEYHWQIEVGYKDDLNLTILLPDKSEEAYANLIQWLENDKELIKKTNENKLIFSAKHKLLEIEQKNSKITLTLNGKNLVKLCDIFNEEKIKKSHHPEDYELFLHYSREEQLVDLLSSLELFAVKAKLSKHPQELSYMLEINVENPNIFINTRIKSFLKIDEREEKIQKIFYPNELSDILNLINKIIIYLKQEENIKQLMRAINELSLSEISEFGNDHSIMPLYLKRHANGFELMIETNECNAVFLKIFMQKFKLETLAQHYFVNYDRLAELHQALTQSLSEFKQKQRLSLTPQLKSKPLVNQLLQLYIEDKVPWETSFLTPSPNRINLTEKLKKELIKFNSPVGNNDLTQLKRLLLSRSEAIKTSPNHKQEVSLIKEVMEILSPLPEIDMESPVVNRKLDF